MDESPNADPLTQKNPLAADTLVTANGNAFPPRWETMAICIGLVLAVWLVFGQTRHHEFVNYDDEGIYASPLIAQGLTWNGITRAFTHPFLFNWHPLTTLSFMLDAQLWGMNPAPFHLTNVLIHGATASLLFLALQALTGARWRSALVAALFAIHPLRVESVAWVAERKDVLSGLFFGLTLLAYARYANESKVQSPKSKVQSPKSKVQGPKSKVQSPTGRFTNHE